MARRDDWLGAAFGAVAALPSFVSITLGFCVIAYQCFLAQNSRLGTLRIRNALIFFGDPDWSDFDYQ